MAAKTSSGRKPGDAAPLLLVTACERNYFLMTTLLLDTLRRRAPGLPVAVLDFGMDEAQRRFLAAEATVLDRPPELAANLHPFHLKAAMAAYLRPMEWQAMAWIDCDMIAVGPLGDRLAAVVGKLGDSGGEVAICRDSLRTVGALLGKSLNLAPFARLLATATIPGTAPYFNTGLFVCRSPDFLAAWAALAAATPMHVNFDQNLFNFLTYTRGSAALELDARVWNVHGELLATTTVEGPIANPKLMAGGAEPALILHPTSSRGDDIAAIGAYETAKGWLHGRLALCRSPALAAVQQAAMARYFPRAADKFHRAGLTLPMNLGR